MSKIRLTIAGVGNCANSLIQGLEYYKDADPSEEVPGLMHVVLGGYHIRDIELVAAFDVDAEKVGLDAGKAIWASENNTVKFADVGELGVTVMRGPTLDGFGEFYRETCEESPAAPVDLAQVLRETRTDVLVSLPPGRLRGGAALLRAGLPRLEDRVRQRHPGIHRERPRVGCEVQGGWRADRRRRHQEPGGRDHHAPHARPPVRG